jgi:hypothetical protein
MDLKSTKNGRIKRARRFRSAADVRTIGSFAGALEAGFSDRIGNQWRFLITRAVKPVRLSFRKTRDFFDVVRLPRLRETQQAHYVFSPTIQLTFPFNPINNVFFEGDANSRFPWLFSEMNALRPAGGRRGVQTNSRQLSDPGGNFGPLQKTKALMLLNDGRLAGSVVSGLQSVHERSWNIMASLLLTVPYAGHANPLRETERVPGFLRSLFNFKGLTGMRSSLHSFFSTVNVVAQRQALMQLALPGSRVRQASPEGSFANSSLTFLTPRPLDGMSGNQVFSPPSLLSYAKRESPQFQEVVNALRDLRPSQSEMKSPAASQLPSIEQLTSHVRQQLERDLRIERERRGL